MIKMLKLIRRRIIIFIRDVRQALVANSFIGSVFKINWSTSQNKIDLLTTSFCNSMCFDCSQMCRQAPANELTTTSQVKKFIGELVQLGKKPKKIIISGGESILQGNIFEIMDLLRQYRDSYNQKLRLVLLTNGRGPKVKRLLTKVPKDIKIINSKKTSSYNPSFISINAAPIDNPKFKKARFEAGCRLTKHCGMAINWNGYYCCATAASIDRVLGLDLALKKYPQIDKSFENQKKILCRYCGNFLSCDYRRGKGYSSESWKKIFKNFKTRKPKLKRY